MFILITLLALLLLLIPLNTILRSSFASEKNRHGNLTVQRAFKKLIEHKKLTVSEVTKFLDRLIAFDQMTGRLIFVVYANNVVWQKCVGFEEVRDCQIVTTTDPQNGHIQKVAIELLLCGNGQKISFSFFDQATEDARDLSRRTKQARYWHSKIHHYLFDHAGRFQWKCNARRRNVAVVTNAIIDNASGGKAVK